MNRNPAPVSDVILFPSLNVGALATLKRHGLAVDSYKTQSWDEFERQPVDVVITVCDNAAGETCPVYFNNAARVHWGLVDPGHIKGTEEEVIATFEKTYGILEQCINKVLQLPLETMSKEPLANAFNAMVD